MASVYAKLDENNNNITEVVSKPSWTLADGSEVTDKHLIPEGYIPVNYDALKPTIDEFYQEAIPNSFTDWTIVSGDVEVYQYNEETDSFDLVTIDAPYEVQVTYTVTEKSLDELKDEFRSRIRQALEDAFNKPYTCDACNADINARRIDLQNMINLQEYMKQNNLTEIDFRIYDNSTITISKDTLDAMIIEVREYHVSLYHHKWEKEQELDSISSIDELKNFEVW